MLMKIVSAHLTQKLNWKYISVFLLILSNNIYIYVKMLSRLHYMKIYCCLEAKQAQLKAPAES